MYCYFCLLHSRKHYLKLALWKHLVRTHISGICWQIPVWCISFCWMFMLKLEAAPLRTHLESVALSKPKTEMTGQLTEDWGIAFQLFPPTAHPWLIPTNVKTTSRSAWKNAIGTGHWPASTEKRGKVMRSMSGKFPSTATPQPWRQVRMHTSIV